MLQNVWNRYRSAQLSSTSTFARPGWAGLGWAGLGWAGLGWALATSDAGLLADALQSLKTDDVTSLNSFSLSYNAGIGDEGASLIANSLPTNLPELGIMGCGLGDASGETLLRWAREAPDLHTMCIEQNRFSDGLRARFNAFDLRRANFLMVV
jgi:hypothetical protein